MKRIFVCAILMTLFFSLFACNKSSTNVENNSSEISFEEVSASNEEKELNLESLETPYATLKLPNNYFEHVSYEITNEDPYTALFRAKKDDTELYSLIFNGTGDLLMGTIVGEKSNTVIYINYSDIDINSENYDEYCGYQEAVSDILNGLTNDYNFVVNEVIEWEDNTTFDINTSVVTMKYPNKWKDMVQVEVTDDEVKFSNNGVLLFELVFVECDGYLLGTYNGTPIYMKDNNVFTDEQIAMQMDVNVIIQNLMEDSNFVINN